MIAVTVVTSRKRTARLVGCKCDYNIMHCFVSKGKGEGGRTKKGVMRGV